METIEFRAKIENDLIRIPARYRGRLKDTVRVILVNDEGETVKQQRVDALFETMQKLSALDEPRMSDAELEAEIAAARAARS